MARGSGVAGLGSEKAAGAARAPGAARTRRAALAPADVIGLLDGLSDGVLVLDRDRRVEYVNEPALTLLGRSPDELRRAHLWSEPPDAAGGALHIADEAARRTGRPQRIVRQLGTGDRRIEARLFPQDERLMVLLRDVTDELSEEDELHGQINRSSEAERIARFGIWEWNIAANRVSWSDELHRIYGLAPGEFPGTVDAFIERVHPDDRERVWANVARSLETQEPFVFEERVLHADGGVRTLLSQGRVLSGPDGAPRALVGVCHDVTERANAEQALGASERRMRAILDNTPSLITVKDLDGRYVMSNAEAGRVSGVQADRLVGMHCVDVFPEAIADVQRSNDRLAATEREPVYDEAVLMRDGEARTYATVTFALPDDDGIPVETCTIATDVTERRERDSQRRDRYDWTARITSALAEDRLLLVAEPIVSLRTGELSSIELLVRMRMPGDRGEIAVPDAFLPAAERYGLIQMIDIWVVEQALKLPPDSVPHVNVSAVTMCDPAATDRIIALLESAPADAPRVMFEVTETASAVQLEAARTFAEAIKRTGCLIALDDFGVGFGSLTYLHALPLHCIKIDRSFVSGIGRSPDDRRVVQAIIGIAREFGVQTIAEGVEDEQTRDLLRELGADYAQGHLVGRAVPL